MSEDRMPWEEFSDSSSSDNSDASPWEEFGGSGEAEQAIDSPVAAPTEKPSATWGERGHDIGLQLASGTAEAGKSVIGLADLANQLNPVNRGMGLLQEKITGEKPKTITEGLKDLGVDFGKSSQAAEDMMSDASKAEAGDVDAAFDEGLIEGGKALLKNPAQIGEMTANSAPGMLSLAMGGRQLVTNLSNRVMEKVLANGGTEEAAMKAAQIAIEKATPMIQRALSGMEGAQSAGSTAADYAAEGQLDDKHALAATGQGITTAALGILSNKIGKYLGLEDLETNLAEGAFKESKQGLAESAVKTAIKEGALEEAPQSASETAWDNYARDKDLTEGVGRSAVEGGLVGAAMGVGGMHRPSVAKAEELAQTQEAGAQLEQEIISDKTASSKHEQDLKKKAAAGASLDEVAEMEADRSAFNAEIERKKSARAALKEKEVTTQQELEDALHQEQFVPATAEQDVAQPATMVEPVTIEENTPQNQEQPGTDSDAQQSADPIVGEPIDKNWTAFAPESGTLNIPRDAMPQIKAEHRGAMVNFLNARGIAHEQEEVPASSLKPTQAEFSQEKVEKAKDYEGGDRSILVSSDGHVLDGHHQWLAKREGDEPVKVIKLDAPIQELLEIIKEFPSAETSEGATTQALTAEAVPENSEQVQAKNPEENLPVEERIARAVQTQHQATGHAPNSDQLAKAFGVPAELASGVRQKFMDSLNPAEQETAKSAAEATEERFTSIFKANQALQERGLKDTHRAWNDGKGFMLVPNEQADAKAAEQEDVRKQREQNAQKNEQDNTQSATSNSADEQNSSFSEQAWEPTVSASGKPFPSEKSAAMSAKQRKIGEFRVEPVEGGFAVMVPPVKEDGKPAATVTADPVVKDESATPKTLAKKITVSKQKAALQREEKRKEHFTAGNIVTAYGGTHDRVIQYETGANGDWKTQVERVEKQPDGTWLTTGKPRWHATEPDRTNKIVQVAPAPANEIDKPAMESEKLAAAVEKSVAQQTLGNKIIDTKKKAAANKSSASESIQDFGEKIGGARKDTASSTQKKGNKISDERPTWAKRFEVTQTVSSTKPEEVGRWFIADTKKKDWTGQSKKAGDRNGYATQAEAEADLPLIAVAQKHRVVPTSDGKYEIWRDVNERKRVKVVDRVFDDRIEAMRYMAEHATEIIETNTTYGEADLPKPPSSQRTGKARRDGNAKDSDFSEVFGFRGVEFGNWNNQAERQDLLNDAYDGLLDLAEVMGIPPKAVSLNGELALAFGARGQGLSGARAHYERAKVVINLTKENGAGTLAHEWFHALDHYFGRQDGKASAVWVTDKDGTRSLKASGSPEADYASAGTRGDRSGMREEVRKIYAELMQTMTKKAEQYVEDTAKVDDFVGRSQNEVKSNLDNIRATLAAQLDPKYWKRNNKPATAEQLAEFDSIAERILAGEFLETKLEDKGGGKKTRGYSLAGYRQTNEALEKINAIMKAVRNRQGFNAEGKGTLDRLRQSMSYYASRLKMLAEAQNNTEKTRMVLTQYAMNAKELDQGRGGDYWTTPHEMAARAFQGYVEDKISEQGGQSPFLNYAPEGLIIPTIWGFKRPYPHGQERNAINQVFDKLVGVLQTRTENGADGKETVMLFNKPHSNAAVMGIDRATADKVVGDFLAKYTGAKELDIKIFDDKVQAYGRDMLARNNLLNSRIKGAYDKNQLHLMLDAHDSAEDLLTTIRHEVWAHHGLGLLPDLQKKRILRAVEIERINSPELNSLWKNRILKDYADESHDEQLEELMAAVAEEYGNLIDAKASESKLAKSVRNLFRILHDALAKTGLISERDGIDKVIDMLVANADRMRIEGGTGNGMLAFNKQADARAEFARKLDDLEARVDAAYESGDIDLADELDAELAAMREMEDSDIDNDEVEHFSLDDALAQTYSQAFIEGKQGSFFDKEGAIANMRENIKTHGGKDMRADVSDEQIVAAGKEAYERKSARLQSMKDRGVKFNKSTPVTYDEKSAPDQELSDEAADAIIQLYKELGSNDDNFEYSRDASSDIDKTVMSVLPSGTKQEADATVIDTAKGLAEEKSQPAILDVKKYKVPTREVVYGKDDKPVLRNGEKQYADFVRDAYVYINEAGELWTDLSDLKRAGGIGGRIYTKLADHAANNDMVFKGDPEGLSDDALLKRTEHMASGIARRKKAASFVPHDRQIDPYSDELHKHSELNKLIRPIRWTKGSDIMNQREVVKTAYHNITTVMPELRHAWIDPDSGRILQRGSPIDAQFRDWVRDLQAGTVEPEILARQGAALRSGRRVYASSSIQRQLLANTIARHVGESEEARRQLLDRLGQWVENVNSRDGRKPFYSKSTGEAPQPAIALLPIAKKPRDIPVRTLQVALDQSIRELYKNGLRLKIHDTFNDLPAETKAEAGASVVRVGKTIHVVRDRIENARSVRRVLRREVKRVRGGMVSPVDFAANVNDAIQAAPAISGAKDEILKMWESVKDGRLAFLTRRHLADVGRKFLPSIQRYVDFAQQMDADRNELLATSAELADNWRKWAAKNRMAADKLANLMHDATIAGVDPDVAYTPVMTPEDAKAQKKVLNEQAFGLGGDSRMIAKIMQKKERIDLLMAQEINRAKVSPDLEKRWKELPEEAKKIWRDVRDEYKARNKMMLKALEDRIEYEVESKEQRKLMIDKLRMEFETRTVHEPYFPLQRFGRYWVAEKGNDGETASFVMFETEAEWSQYRDAMQRTGLQIKSGKQIQQVFNDKRVDPGFVADVDELLHSLPNETSEQLRDQVYQLYLNTLPNLSARKHFIHRKATEGFSQDAIRAFAKNSFHGGYQLARLQWAHRLEKVVRDAEEAVKVAGDEDAVAALEDQVLEGQADPEQLFNARAASKDVVKASDLLGELKKRHEWTMNPKGGPVANKLSGLGFAWYLGGTPAAALVNLTQVPLVAFPVMGSRFGMAKASAEITKAYRDYLKGGAGVEAFFSMSKSLDGEELAAYQEFVRAGVIDKSLAHDLAGIAEEGSDYSEGWHKAMSILSWGFHKAEVMNREITAMASYRLARQTGLSHEKAIAIGSDITWESQFDYSTGNKARFMQNDAAKILLMFRQYALNMTYMIYRSGYQALAEERPLVRSQARKKLAAMTIMNLMAVGALGVLPEPIYPILKTIIESIGGDDDEPFDMETELRILLAELFGEKGGQAIARGLGNAAGIDLAGRLSLTNLWVRATDKELEGKDAWHFYTDQLLGPIGGIVSGMFNGAKLINDGYTARGLEMMMPKAVRDALKMIRYANEGARSLRGDPLVEDVNGLELFSQAMGFTPSRLADRYAENSAKMGYQDKIEGRRKKLIDRYALALRLGDVEMRKETQTMIAVFNRKNPTVAVTGETLQRSMKTRAAHSRKAENGIPVNKKLRGDLERIDFATE